MTLGNHDRFAKGYNHPDNQRLRQERAKRESDARAEQQLREYKKSYSSFKARGAEEIKKLMAQRKAKGIRPADRKALDMKIKRINAEIKKNKNPSKEQMRQFAEERSAVLRKTWWQKLTG